ncbi:hypothetical protein RHGRI_001953 [Rhododendron griersonianum]|uniref:Pentatricopeptide repeat-containing protein n=1 Tax=Rhododendron griersonianum TaxID=479676 RepID=A0AAV6LM25_9ERIC|nr:hypothetical protein RHGRI_001953 [Rhododendron griersonianum]
MLSRQFQTLRHLQKSTTTTHLLQLQSLILKTALDRDEYFISKFIQSSCSVSIEFTRLFFDSLLPLDPPPPTFAFNTIIREYSKSSSPLESVKLFSQLQRVGLKPDKFTYPFVLKSCGRCSVIGVGGAVHSLVVKMGIDSDRNCPVDALMVFQSMKLVNQNPNSVTLVSLLSACTRLLNIRIGTSIHSHVIVNNIKLDVALGTALLEMYSKCGRIEVALRVFSSLEEKNLQSWTIMISGVADHGRGEDAISLFTQMEENGLKPDSLSFSGILSACSHLGLVEEGKRYFDQMVNTYGIKPTMEHYGCMIDMLGRAGMIEEAYRVIKSMPMEPNSVILRSFIGASKNHGEVVCLDENLRKLLLQIEPDLGANYVLAACVSSVSENWNDVASLRDAMKGRRLKKAPGCSWVEVNSASSGEIIQPAVG